MDCYLVSMPVIITISLCGIGVFMLQTNGQDLGNKVSAARANNISDAT
jgi:hypothetical protein